MAVCSSPPRSIRIPGLSRVKYVFLMSLPEMRLRLIRPLQIGLESVKAIVLPAAVLWSAAGALVAGYYGFDCVRSAMEPVECRLAGLGAWGGFVSLAFYLGMLPGVFFLFVRSLRPKHPWTTCIAQSGWNGLWGVACTYFFQLQDGLFGTGRDFCTLAAKTALDQFFWTAFVIAPLNAVFYFLVEPRFFDCPRSYRLAKGIFQESGDAELADELDRRHPEQFCRVCLSFRAADTSRRSSRCVLGACVSADRQTVRADGCDDVPRNNGQFGRVTLALAEPSKLPGVQLNFVLDIRVR